MILNAYGINTALIPAGGWRYEEANPDGSITRVPFSGQAPNSDRLIEMLRSFRIDNNLPMGDPAFDVAEFIRRVSPQNNRWGRSRKMAEKIQRSNKTPKNTPLIERIGNWISRLAPRRPKLVSFYDANQRVPICANCRHNVKWATKCLPCIEKVNSMGQNLRQQVVAEGPDTLLACRLHELHLPSAVFIDIDYLPTREAEAPETCWLRKEQP